MLAVMYKVWVAPYWARKLDITVPFETHDLKILENGFVRLAPNKVINIKHLDCFSSDHEQETLKNDAEQSGAKT